MHSLPPPIAARCPIVDPLCASLSCASLTPVHCPPRPACGQHHCALFVLIMLSLMRHLMRPLLPLVKVGATMVTCENDDGNLPCALCIRHTPRTMCALDLAPLLGASSLPSAPDVSPTLLTQHAHRCERLWQQARTTTGTAMASTVPPLGHNNWIFFASDNHWCQSDGCWHVVSVRWVEGGQSCGANTIVCDHHRRHGVI